MQIEFEEIKDLLKDISTPTGITDSGDKTLTEDNSNDIINYIDNLQQRIDKAITFAYKNIDNVLTRDTLISILQDEKAKDNEI